MTWVEGCLLGVQCLQLAEVPERCAAHREKTDVLSSEDDAPDSPVILEAPSLPPLPPAYTPAYKKSLRLSSDQIVSVSMWDGGGGITLSQSPSVTKA